MPPPSAAARVEPEPPPPLPAPPAWSIASLEDELRALDVGSPEAPIDDDSGRPLVEIAIEPPLEHKPKPPAIEPAAVVAPPCFDPLEIEAFEQAIDAAFEAVRAEATADPRVEYDADTRDELRSLFCSIAANHLTQLRDFVIELSRGECSRQWARICLPAVISLRKAAQSIPANPLAPVLEAFEDVLHDVATEGGGMIDGFDRERLLRAHAALAELLPDAFDVQRERDRREPIIVHALLEQVAGVYLLEIERLYGAGLTSLDAYYKARSSEVAETTGLEARLCVSILERFDGYRSERVTGPLSTDGSHERSKLADLTRRLEAEERAFQTISDDGQRRAIRRRRSVLVHEINLHLAELGEVALVEELERVPVSRKLAELDRFLQKASTQAAPALSLGA